MSRRRRAGTVAVLMTLVLATAACTTTIAGSSSTEVPMTTPLAQRPSIDTVVETYDRMQVEIREAVSRLRPKT